MYHTYYPQPLWPLSAAPLPPVSDTALHVVAELSGTWEGGTVPGLYADSTWQLSREIALPDSAWLYVPYLVGEVSVYVGERLWSRGERLAWIPLIGPGKVKLTLRGKGRGAFWAAYTSWPEKAPWPGRWTPIALAPLRFYQRRFSRSAQKQQSPLTLSGCGLLACFCGLFPPGGAFPSGKHTAEAPGQPYPPIRWKISWA